MNKHGGTTYYGEPLDGSEKVIETPFGDFIYPEDLLRYALDVDDYSPVITPTYDGLVREKELEGSDFITDTRRDESLND